MKNLKRMLLWLVVAPTVLRGLRQPPPLLLLLLLPRLVQLRVLAKWMVQMPRGSVNNPTPVWALLVGCMAGRQGPDQDQVRRLLPRPPPARRQRPCGCQPITEEEQVKAPATSAAEATTRPLLLLLLLVVV
jgi:hypothetical protein